MTQRAQGFHKVSQGFGYLEMCWFVIVLVLLNCGFHESLLKNMKDRFSTANKSYAKFRPDYPNSLIQYLVSLTPNSTNVWDCGTGNGQLAKHLAEYFQSVYATDISENQLHEAFQKENIYYSKQSAEHTKFQDNQFDMVTVAQAVHWFDGLAFANEVKRVLKPGGIIVLIGYGLLSINDDIDPSLQSFYTDIVGPYWDPERKHIDSAYQDIHFPYKELTTPTFVQHYDWTHDQFIGYLGTWSSVKRYIDNKGESPIPWIIDKTAANWTDTLRVSFPIFLRVGKLQ